MSSFISYFFSLLVWLETGVKVGVGCLLTVAELAPLTREY